MSYIIKLQHLARQARAADIRAFFSGLSIPSGAVCIVGGDSGEAFIGFETDEDARLAMLRSSQLLCQQPVELSLSSRKEMNNAMEEAKKLSRLLQNISKPSETSRDSNNSSSFAESQENTANQASSSAAPPKISEILGTTDTNWTAFLEQALERIEKAKDAPIGHQSSISFGSPSVLGHKPTGAETPVIIEQLPSPEEDSVYSVYTDQPPPKFEPPGYFASKSYEAGYGRQGEKQNYGNTPSLAPQQNTSRSSEASTGRYDSQRPQDNKPDRYGQQRNRFNQPGNGRPPQRGPDITGPRNERNLSWNADPEIRTTRGPDHFGRPNQPNNHGVAPPADPEHRPEPGSDHRSQFPGTGPRAQPFDRTPRNEGRGFFGAPRIGLERNKPPRNEDPKLTARNDGNRFGEGTEENGRFPARNDQNTRFSGLPGQRFGFRDETAGPARNDQERYGQRAEISPRFGTKDGSFGNSRDNGQGMGPPRDGSGQNQGFGQSRGPNRQPFQRPNQENGPRQMNQNNGKYGQNDPGASFPRRDLDGQQDNRGGFDPNRPFQESQPQIWADRRMEERTQNAWNQPPPSQPQSTGRFQQNDRFGPTNPFDSNPNAQRSFNGPPPFSEPSKIGGQPPTDMTPEMLEMLRIQQQAMAALSASNVPQHVDPEEMFVELSRLPPNLEQHQSLKGFLGIPVECRSVSENGVLVHTIVKCSKKEDARRLIQRDGELGIKIRWSDRKTFEESPSEPPHGDRKRRHPSNETPVPAKIPENQSWVNTNRQKAGYVLLLNAPYKSNEREVLNFLRIATVYNVELKQVCEPNYTRSDAWVVTLFDIVDMQKLFGHRGTIDGRNIRVFVIPNEIAEVLLAEGIRDRKKLDEDLKSLPREPPQAQPIIPSLLSLTPAVVNQPPRLPPTAMPRPNGRPPMFFGGHQPAIHHKFSRNKRDSGGVPYEECTSNDQTYDESMENGGYNLIVDDPSTAEEMNPEESPKVIYASFDQPSKMDVDPIHEHPAGNEGSPQKGDENTENHSNFNQSQQQRPQYGRGRGRGRRQFDNNRGRRLY